MSNEDIIGEIEGLADEYQTLSEDYELGIVQGACVELLARTIGFEALEAGLDDETTKQIQMKSVSSFLTIIRTATDMIRDIPPSIEDN